MGGDYRRGGDDRGKKDDFDFRKDEYKDDRFRQQPPSGGGGDGDDCNSQVIGWVVFILIFGVGNAILYSTTGMLIIPIRR
jgi:hypothetical protein